MKRDSVVPPTGALSPWGKVSVREVVGVRAPLTPSSLGGTGRTAR
jgi:hypothetical protein